MKLTKEQIQEQIKDLQRLLEELDKSYWTLGFVGDYLSAVKVDNDESCFEIIKDYNELLGIKFDTEQQAQDHIEYLNAKRDYLNFIREWNGDRVIDWNDEKIWKYYCYYEPELDEVKVESSRCIDKPTCLYFLLDRSRGFLAEVTEKLGKDKVILAITGKKL